MNEKRKIQRFNLDEDKIWEAIEGLSPYKTTYTLEEVCKKLNELATKCNLLENENDKLRGLIKGNVFGRYREGSLADLEFKATAYDDIAKLEMSYESEPKVIVICKQGKKENVKSFCQMFIPFGIAYEIVEMIDDE